MKLVNRLWAAVGPEAEMETKVEARSSSGRATHAKIRQYVSSVKGTLMQRDQGSPSTLSVKARRSAWASFSCLSQED